MRVLQLLTQSTGGPVDHVRITAPAIQARGAHVVAVLPDSDAADDLEQSGVEVRRLTVNSKWDVGKSSVLLRTLSGVRADVIHCQDRRAGLIGRVAGAMLRVPGLVYTLHGVPDSLAHLVPGNLQVAPTRLRDVAYYRWSEAALSALGNQLVVLPSRVLETYATGFAGIPASRLRHVRNGVDPSHFSVGGERSLSDAYSACWVGLMAPVKRVDLALAAVARTEGVHLTLIGDGPCRKDLEDQATAAGLGERCAFVGFRHDVPGLLAAHEVLLLPSAAENCPLALLQGMASGCAVVAAAVGGVPEMVQHDVDGLLFRPGDVDDLVTQLTRLRDPNLRSRLGRAARLKVERELSVDQCADGLLHVYSELVDADDTDVGDTAAPQQDGKCRR